MKSRQAQIYHIIQSEESVSVEDLAKRFNLTKKTIRLDLQSLEDGGLINRNFGGATLAVHTSPIFPGPSYNSSSFKQKYEIARKALEFIKPNYTVILDDGTTTQMIARLLPDMPLTVITNDLGIVYELLKKINVNIYLIGGNIMRSDSRSHTTVSSDKDLNYLKRLNIDLCFVGTNSINVNNGFMVFNDFVCQNKKVYFSVANKVICVADSKKFNKSSFYKFADFKDIPIAITDSSFNPYNLPAYAKKGLEIIIADKMEGDINGSF